MKKLLFALCLMIGFKAQAGFLAEPFVGYSTADFSGTTAAGLSGKSTLSGFTYGARLGYYFNPKYWAALEYLGASGKDKADNSEEDYSKVAISAIFGYDFGKYNLWLGYGVSDKLTYTRTDVYVSGTNFKIGLGTEVAQNISINVEVIIPTYTKYGNATIEKDMSTAFSKFDMTTFMVSVSAPFGAGK